MEAPSPLARQLMDTAVAMVEADERIQALTLGGSAVLRAMDEFSDLDLVIVCGDHDRSAVFSEAAGFAARLGPLLASFTGEHVGESRLLICLYGPPLLHVDLKFVAVAELAQRTEDAVVLWEREPGTVARASAGTSAAWPQPDRQWIEDRFWIWVHYATAKIGRGELFEAIDALSFLRATVLGPLLAIKHGRRPQGVRRLEQYAAQAVPTLEETVADHSRAGCIRALGATIRLYRQLRDDGDGRLTRNSSAERASVEYLEQMAGEAMQV